MDRKTELLLVPSAYPHSVNTPVELIETHISMVFLAGHFAYKLKKSLVNDFLDYGSLEKRHAACVAELNLGKRFAPELYIDVVPITMEEGELRVDGDAPPIDFAVRMRRFSSESLLSKRLAQSTVTETEVEQLGKSIARFHADAPKVTGERSGGVAAIGQRALENIAALAHTDAFADSADLAQVDLWTNQQWGELKERFAIREQLGWIRECHGDLHCNNVVYFRDSWTMFDGIEFNDQLSCIDTMSDIAFLVMDLLERKHSGLAWMLLNAYLEESGDYHGLSVFQWYLVYRAMVRAKVAVMRAAQWGDSDEKREGEIDLARDYLQLACEFTKGNSRELWITHGLSGSGKTTGSRWAIRDHGMIRLRSDIERKRLFHLSYLEPKTTDLSDASSATAARDIKAGLYSTSATEATYRSLWSLSRELLLAGFSVLVDATFLKESDRKRFSSLAQTMNIPFRILEFRNDVRVLEQRILHRKSLGLDASDADVEVLHKQIKSLEPLTESEQRLV
ncbi:AAA family ATPase [Pirellulaceae bacterium SH449]